MKFAEIISIEVNDKQPETDFVWKVKDKVTIKTDNGVCLYKQGSYLRIWSPKIELYMEDDSFVIYVKGFIREYGKENYKLAAFGFNVL